MMYPLCYSTGEPIRFGDRVEWTDEGGNRHEFTLGRVSYMPHGGVPAEREASSHWRQERWADEGADHVLLTGDVSADDASVLLQRREDLRVPLRSLRFIRRTVPMTYCSGEPVRDGDWVAEEGHYTLYRLRVMYVKSHAEPWLEGSQPFIWQCDLTSDHAPVGLVTPYMENGAFEPCWEHIHFVSHGTIDSELATWWEKHGMTPAEQA